MLIICSISIIFSRTFVKWLWSHWHTSLSEESPNFDLGHICPVVFFSVAHELKTFRIVFMRLKKVKRKSIFCNMWKLYGVLIFINANQVLMDQSYIYHLGVCICLLLHFQSWKATTDTVCPTNPKIYVSHKKTFDNLVLHD